MSFIREGQTCWRATRADRAALLLDGAGYFAALRASLLKAERSILVAGWDIDSRTPIRGASRPDDGAPQTLAELLTYLVNDRTELVVHVLLWDYSLLYALEREPLPRVNLDWRTPRRIKVCLDNRLPFGASHHEKLVVIDDHVAYCGGIDLTIRRWDRPEHRVDEADRVDPDGEPYGPYHDLQMVVAGETAGALGELVRARWNRAANGKLEAASVGSDAWPEGLEPDFRDVAIGISRTRPAFDGERELREVEAAYHDAIGRAERLIYIENQYLTAIPIAEALRRRLDERPSLEIVIVSPRSPEGWLEQQTMGVGRTRFMRELGDAGRAVVFYPWVGGRDERVPIMVHAKLMIVDDRLLHIGSSNLSCRSMGVDRECDLHLEARTNAERAQVEALRRKLVAHHLGLGVEELAAREAAEGSIIAVIGGHASSERGLSRIEIPDESAELADDFLVDIADPERPLDPDEFIGDLFGATPAQPIRRHLLKLIGIAAVISIALVVWRFSPLVDLAEPERLAALLEGVRASAWGPPIVLAAFVLGSFVAFPVTVMIAAAAVALGPVDGFVWAFVGSMLAAAINYGCGRLIPGHTLERWVGTWINRVSKRLRRGGIVSIMVVRNVPIAPFTVVNVVAGAARIPLGDYLIGTALGMLPGIAALTILGDRLRGALADPSLANFGLLILAILLWIAVALGLQALSNRVADAR